MNNNELDGFLVSSKNHDAEDSVPRRFLHPATKDHVDDGSAGSDSGVKKKGFDSVLQIYSIKFVVSYLLVAELSSLRFGCREWTDSLSQKRPLLYKTVRALVGGGEREEISFSVTIISIVLQLFLLLIPHFNLVILHIQNN